MACFNDAIESGFKCTDVENEARHVTPTRAEVPTSTPEDCSAPTNRKPANPKPAAGSQTATVVKFGSRRLSPPTARARAKDTLVACSRPTGQRSLSEYGSEAES